MRKTNKCYIWLIALLFGNGLIFSQPPDKINIAVIDLESQGGITQQEATILTNRLRSKLVETNTFNVLERGLMDEVLKEQGFQQTGCTSTECAVEIGKILNMRQMVTGNIGKLGNLYTLDIVLIDVETSQIMKSLTRDYRGEIEGLIELMKSIANELAGIGKPIPETSIPNVTGLGIVEIISEPSQATIYIDGIKVGLTPYKLDELKAGEHTVKLVKKGYIDYEESFTVVSGQTKIIEVSLPRLNVLTIKTIPQGASFYLDDVLKGITPVILELRTGSYKMKLTKNGYADWEQELTINEDYAPEIRLLKIYNIDFSSVPPQANVYLDNKFIGKTPFTFSLAEGAHTVKIHLDNYQDYERQIRLQKDMQVKAKLKPVKKRKDQIQIAKGSTKSGRKWMWMGAAAVIGGGVYYYMTVTNEKQESGFPEPPGRP